MDSQQMLDSQPAPYSRTALRRRGHLSPADRRAADLERRIAELEQANAELLEFAHMTAHDLREPLATVGLLAETLGSDADPRLGDSQRRLIAAIGEGVDHMRATVDQALASVRGAAERSEEVDMAQVVDCARRAIGWRLQSNRVTMRVGPLPTVAGDRTQLVRLMQNLLSNALEHLQDVDAPHVSIDAERDGGHWRFAVRDNGVGVDPTGRDGARGPGAGFGLGLAICRAVVERHGGRISLDAAPDRGAIVTFTLPATTDRSAR